MLVGDSRGVLLLARPEATDRTSPILATQHGVPRTGSRLRLALCGILVVLGVTVIVGWLRDIPLLTSVAPGLPTMKFNTAAAFILTGAGLALAGTERRSPRYAGAALGVLLLCIGVATLIEYAFPVDLGIDQAVVADTGTLRGSGFPGRMSLLTAGAWVMLGMAILLLGTASRRTEVIVAHSLAMTAGAVSVLSAAGYAFGAEAFWGIGPYTYIAVHTATGLLVAATTALMTRAREGWLQPYADSPAALALLRRILPLALGLPTLLGLLIMLGAGLRAYNAPYGFALFIPVTSVAMVLTALWVASRQRDAEQIRLRYERHLQLVVAELNHRVKNTLSIVQSFAHQSLKSSTSPEAAGAAFEGRLTALASAHKVLTRENWDKVSLIELVANSLDAHNDTGTRFAVEGHDMAVSPKTAITLAMTLHELATNSTKYGALSKPDGYVRVSWGNQDGRFRMEWKDIDGPPVRQPERTGFGTRMLTRALASELGGKALLRYEPDGVRYAISAPARAEL
jgi:two-component sensor histidine kinase